MVGVNYCYISSSQWNFKTLKEFKELIEKYIEVHGEDTLIEEDYDNGIILSRPGSQYYFEKKNGLFVYNSKKGVYEVVNNSEGNSQENE